MTPQPARRLTEVGEYYFSRKLETIRQMNSQGRDVINLGIGSPDAPPAPEVIQAAVQTLNSENSHGYASYRSSPELRSAISAWYRTTYGVHADPAREILPLLGSKEGLMYISMAYLNPGDRALVPNPGYPAYSTVTRMAGAEPIFYDLCEETRWEPDFNSLERLDLSRVKLMWVNYPHMPTGRAAHPALFERLIEFGRQHGILICHDNPYSQVLNPDRPLSILEFDPKMEVSLELNSLSKSFHMAGWRVGMLMAPTHVIDTVLKVKSNVDSGMFAPIQMGAIAALRMGLTWHERRNELYAERREQVYRIFDTLGFEYEDDQVGLFVWAKAPETVKDVAGFLDEVLVEAAVFLTPGFVFGTKGRRYARSSLCTGTDRLKEALERIKRAI